MGLNSTKKGTQTIPTLFAIQPFRPTQRPYYVYSHSEVFIATETRIGWIANIWFYLPVFGYIRGYS